MSTKEGSIGLPTPSWFTFLYEWTLHWIEEICDTPAELLAGQDATAVCGEEAWQPVGGKERISESTVFLIGYRF
ncbi:hypothetical protein [Peribacillus sp. V2I11]|uniref:hypothetical protein n=1 Tax=Peribacillus sp. V2I11 TaxID=3042277 RepID=UPI002787D14F|nr:hypothetical protein [Peribacillus sp. V2I11]MDQ0881845.1 hypothetical protein [Peribacillus sp. V2I11]